MLSRSGRNSLMENSRPKGKYFLLNVENGGQWTLCLINFRNTKNLLFVSTNEEDSADEECPWWSQAFNSDTQGAKKGSAKN
jgi:hypothetical protein